MSQSGKITVLIADDSEQMRQSVRTMLSMEPDIQVVGEAADGFAAVAKARELRPHVVLMDVNMPGLDGIAATQAILQEITTGVLIISVQGEKEYLRRAMQAGARDYLVKPFSLDELAQAIRSVAQTADLDPLARSLPASPKGLVFTVFSTKGGVGKTTLAVNLAAALAARAKKRVALLDLDLEFGCIASMSGLKPAHTIADLCRYEGPLTVDVLQQVMLTQQGGLVSILPAPLSPEQAAEVDGEGRRQKDRDYIGEILRLAREAFDYVIIDTASNFRETTMSALDAADKILLVAAPDIPTLHNTAKCLDILLLRLQYPREKVALVLNRADSTIGLSAEDIARSLDCPVAHYIPSDGPTAIWGANSGQPFVLRRARTGLADAVNDLADMLRGSKPFEKAEVEPRRRGLFGLTPF